MTTIAAASANPALAAHAYDHGAPVHVATASEVVALASGGASSKSVDAGVASVLDLPLSFKKTIAGDHDSANVASHLEADDNGMAVLQHSADDGMRAAYDAAHGRSEADASERYRDDVAFRAGFDAYQYAKGHSPADVAALDKRFAPPQGPGMERHFIRG